MAGHSVSVFIVTGSATEANDARNAIETANPEAVVSIAQTLGEFRERVAGDPPDIAVMDLDLPDGRAVDVLTSPPESGPFPVVVIIENGHCQAAAEVMDAGAIDYIARSSAAISDLAHAIDRSWREWGLRLDRKRAQAAFEAGNARFEAVFHGNPAGISISRLSDGRIVDINRALLDILDYADACAIGRTTTELGVWPYPEQRVELVERLCREGRLHGYETLFRRKTGEIGELSISAELVRMDGEDFIVAMMQDVTERKRAEANLRRSEEFLRLVIDESPHAMWISDEHGTLIRLNRACCALLNVTPDEVVGKFNMFQDSIVEEEGHMPLLRRVFERGESVSFTLNYDTSMLKQIKLKRPTHVVIDVTISPIKDEEGRVRNAVIQHVDVTHRVHAETALARGKALLDQAQRIAKVGGWEYDVASGKSMWTHQVYDIYGVSSDEYDPNNIPNNIRFYTPEAQATVERAFTRAITEGAPYDLELEFTNAQGDPLWVRTSGQAERRDGKVVRVFGHIMDITERRRAEESLRESEARLAESNQLLAGILENTHMMVVFLDTRFNFVWVNRAYAQTCCHDPEFFPGQNYFALYPDEENQALFRRVVETGKPSFSYATPLIFPDQPDRGVTYWDRGLVPMRNAENAISGLVFTLADVTDRRRAEEALRQSEEHLRQAQRMESVGRLAGGIAHDFNNILQAMMGRIDFLTEEVGPEDPRYEDLAGIRHGIDRAANLVRQLLAFGRRQILDLRPIDLNSLVGDFVKMLRRIIGEDIALQFVAHEPRCFIQADPVQIEQVLMSLCVNARDAMPEGGSLTLETQHAFLDEQASQTNAGATPGPCVLLRVTDTGIGMDEKTVARVFDPFFTTKEVGKGTGLGLAMTYGLIAQHHGAIEVMSQPGHGTEFRVFLPRVEHPDESEIDKEERPKPKGGSETILLAEDEEMVRRMTERILTGAGYRVIASSDGEEAIAVFDAHRDEVALAILDVVMPKKSGRHVHNHIKSVAPHVPILFCSGYSDNAVHTQFILDSGIEFIPKPFRPNALLDRVRLILDASRG
ncbi:MAG TPA: PAS domain S-box protein [Candidatus Hydrogenedentes bacterium]|nr:PAS domain S-box protein [Candidatus Hydrogenedentota bacterium]HPG65434.1 PAS domain S-box protein [Candidatus Hydrogenedentota bacterium]